MKIYVKCINLCVRMSGETGTRQWPSIDQWWSTYSETESVICLTPIATALNPKRVEVVPKEIDTWWEAYTNTEVVRSTYGDRIDDLSLEEEWTELGTWWDAYKETRSDDIAELDQILTESNALWDRRNGLFNADPLSADLDQSTRGSQPLNPGKEEEWSDWLAKLLRGDSGEFHRELFGEIFETSPRRVEREAYFPNPSGKDRYADILSLHDSEKISIEVKIGDTNFKKTTDTTALIEDQHYGEWRHYLLLPEQDLWAVRESFDVDVTASNGERATIPSEESEEVGILYWSDVSRALRSVLVGENTQTPHWSASAYLFCARIEQDRLGFTPQPIVDQIGTEAGKVQSFRSVSVLIGDIEEQIEYLTAFMEVNNE